MILHTLHSTNYPTSLLHVCPCVNTEEGGYCWCRSYGISFIDNPFVSEKGWQQCLQQNRFTRQQEVKASRQSNNTFSSYSFVSVLLLKMLLTVVKGFFPSVNTSLPSQIGPEFCQSVNSRHDVNIKLAFMVKHDCIYQSNSYPVVKL